MPSVTHPRAVALLIGLTVVAAGCTGPVGSTSISGLTIRITDLPAGVAGNVLVTGPAGYRAQVVRTSTLRAPAGQYLVTAAGVRVGTDTYYAQHVAMQVRAPGTLVVGYAEQVPDTTKVLDATELGLLPGTSATGATMTFLPGTPGARLRPGDVVVVAAGPSTPHGLVRKVVSVAAGADKVLVGVVPAGLRDAIPHGAFSARLSVDPTATVGLGSGSPCGSGANLAGSASASIDGYIDFDMAWGFLTPNYIKLVGGISEKGDASLKVQVQGSCKVSADSEGLPLSVIPIDLGPVVLEVTPVLVAHGEASGMFTAGPQYGFSEAGWAKAGFTWGTPDGSNQDLHPIFGVGASFTATPPNESPQETLWAGAGPQVDFDIDGLDGGPVVNFLGGINVTNTQNTDGSYHYAVSSAGKVNVGIRAQWGPLNFSLSQPFTLPGKTLFQGDYGTPASTSPSAGWDCAARTFQQVLANPNETEVAPVGQPKCLDGYAVMNFTSPAGQAAPFFFVFSAGKWSLIEGGNAVPTKACTVIPHQVMSAWGYGCSSPANNPAAGPSGTSVAAGHGSPAAAVAGLLGSEMKGDWSGACSYVQPDAQATCASLEGGNPAASGHYQIAATVTQGTEALVEVTGVFSAPGSPTLSNSDPTSGMPSSQTDFQTVYDNLVSNSSSVLSPEPCVEVNGRWYANVGG